MLSLKESLKILKRSDALLEGHFILSSGLHSPKYIQCAKLLSHPYLAEKIVNSLVKKIKQNIKKIDVILSPAMGGVIIGNYVGKKLKKEAIFCERVEGKFKLRRGFKIYKGQRVLIVEDVVTTGKSSKECYSLIKKYKGKLIGCACLIDRTNNNKLTLKTKLISQLKLNVPTYNKKNLPNFLEKVKITKPGSRFIK